MASFRAAFARGFFELSNTLWVIVRRVLCVASSGAFRVKKLMQDLARQPLFSLSRTTTRLLTLLAGCLFVINASAQAPLGCKQFGGRYDCTPAQDVYFSSGSLNPGGIYVQASTPVGVTSKLQAEVNRRNREAASLTNATFWLELEYVVGSCDQGIANISTAVGNGWWQGYQANCLYDSYKVTSTTREFSSHVGGVIGVAAWAFCPQGTTLTGFSYTAADAPPGVTIGFGQGVNPPWFCVAPIDHSKTYGPPPCNGTNNGTNPINGGTGNKFQQETDLIGASSSSLHFDRYYNSQRAIAGRLGSYWTDSFDH